MILTAIYLLICWLSTQIQVDYHLLTATVVIDIVWMMLGYLVNISKV